MEMNNKIMENMEIWKDVENYEGLYQVSNLGRVRSLERDIYCQNGTFHQHLKEKMLVPVLDRYGYQFVGLYKNGKRKKITVHRLVAEAFLPNLENKPQVNHKDENPLNNCVDNLEWRTSKYNINYGTRTARQIQNRRSYKLGDNPRAKSVFCVELNKTFDCAQRAQEELGIDRKCIGKACTGKQKTAGKFHWRYVDEND